MSNVLLLYGNTASGKSTLGRLLAERKGLHYRSFGELIQEVQDPYINEFIKVGKPIPVFAAMQVIRYGMREGCDYSLSGFPISMEELRAFTSEYNIIGSVHLLISEEVARIRFAERKRDRDTPEYLEKRLRLYRERIAPFIEELSHTGLSILTLSTDVLDENEVMNHVLSWL